MDSDTEMENEKVIERDRPEPIESRAAYVEQWLDTIQTAKKHWKNHFDKINSNLKFLGGQQWPDEQSRYTANLIQRHIKQRVAGLYAKNPKAVAKRRERLDLIYWDGEMTSLQMAMEALQTNPQDQQSLMILQEAQQVKATREMLDKIGKTLEILFHYYLDEQLPRFKKQAKRLVARTCATGVAFVKLGFQRVLEKAPEVRKAILDVSEQIAHLEALSADLADGEIEVHSAKMEELRLGMTALQEKQELITREGLVMDFPKTTSLIIDPDCTQIDGFIGAAFVAEQYTYSPDKIKALYGIDVSKSVTTDSEGNSNQLVADKKKGKANVYQIYCINTGLMYTVCEGYPDFLEEPQAPGVELEQFYPYFSLMFNEVESEKDIYPPSDVELLYWMQIEHNDSRHALREHRRANRPKYIAPKGVLEEEDKDKLMAALPHEVIELAGIDPSMDIGKIVQHLKQAGIDQAMYDTSHILSDIELVGGSQEANLGGTSNATATESSIAEGSRLSSVSSNVDDLDDMLTDLARAAGQVLLTEMSIEQVKKIAGDGAVWPEMSRESIVDEIFLEVQAGSSGRPNMAQEIANIERLAPTILQIPGIDPTWFGKEVLRRMDDRLDLSDAFLKGIPSIISMNGQSQLGTGDPKTDPNAQGANGASNNVNTSSGAPGAQPGYPNPDAVV